MPPKKTILAVDDNPLNLGILEEILAGEYGLKVAQSGRDAIEYAAHCPPAAVLLDVMMPGMDGLETCRQLRELPGLRKTTIIMVSAKAMPSEREAGLQAGADDYITKPFDEDDLLAVLQRHLNPADQEAGLAIAVSESTGVVSR